MHPLQAEHQRIHARIVQRKREIRQIRITLQMDAAALARVERDLEAAGITFQRVRPVLNGGRREE